jgi:biotin carboxyl carrier protein
MSDEHASARHRLRVRVDDDPDQTWDVGPDEVPARDDGTSQRSHEVVHEVPAGSADRAAGIRRFRVTVDGWQFGVSVEAEARARVRERATQDEVARHSHGPLTVRAAMTGRVVRVWVAEGATVEAGQRRLAIEAMKMENEVRAPRAGVVASIGVAVDDSVEHGDELLTVR